MFRLIAVFILLTNCAAAQSVTLSGLVMDGSAGVPLAGATVTLNNVRTLKNVGLFLTTDAEGRYSFKDATSTNETFVSQVKLTR